MPGKKAFVTQAEIARLAKGMRAAGIYEFSIKVEKPDGTRIAITAGKATEAGPDDADDIDAMIDKVPHAIS